jgi:hypothetical protein
MLKTLFQDTKKNTMIGECQIVMLLIAYSEIPIHFAEWDFGCPRSVRNVRMKERIFETVERQSAVSSRRLAARTEISHASVQYM